MPRDFLQTHAVPVLSVVSQGNVVISFNDLVVDIESSAPSRWDAKLLRVLCCLAPISDLVMDIELSAHEVVSPNVNFIVHASDCATHEEKVPCDFLQTHAVPVLLLGPDL